MCDRVLPYFKSQLKLGTVTAPLPEAELEASLRYHFSKGRLFLRKEKKRKDQVKRHLLFEGHRNTFKWWRLPFEHFPPVSLEE